MCPPLTSYKLCLDLWAFDVLSPGVYLVHNMDLVNSVRFQIRALIALWLDSVRCGQRECVCVCVCARARACMRAVQCTRVWLWHSLFSVGSLTQKPQLHQEQCTSEQGAQTIKGQQEAEVCGKNLVFYLLLQSLISCVSVHLLRLLVDDKRERLAESSKGS